MPICWQSGVFFVSTLCLLFKVPFTLLLRATNSFCSYYWVLMSVCTEQWQAVIRFFNADLSCISITKFRCIFIGQKSKIILFFFCWFFVLILLLKHVDIEVNPGPKEILSKCFSCCHWNVNSIFAHNKPSLLNAYNSALNYDLICLTKTYVD